MPPLPADPFALLPATGGAEPAARRQLRVFGVQVELVWLPDRAVRPGVPTGSPTRPQFRPPRAEHILATETVWRTDGCALTPNRYPFAARELLLWAEDPVREPTAALTATALAFEEAVAGTVLANSMGAAASITRAHVHVLGETLPFLEELRHEPYHIDGIELGDVETLRLAAPWPGLAVGLRGPAAARARGLQALLEARTALAFNVASQRGVTWLFPRSATEIPAPFFPHALGGAELWGRWCYADQGDFEAATPAGLEQALRVSLT